MKPRILSTPWRMIFLLFLVALINYFDRQSLSVVAPRMQAEMHLSDRGYGHVVSAFLLASALAYAVSGFITDALGAKRSMALFVGWWSVAEAVTSVVTTGTQLGLARFCLGLGEPGLWVAAPKAVSETVPEERRSLAIGIYTSGATVGAVIALPAIVFVISRLSYRSIFWLDGAAGLIWLPFWLFCYRHVESTAREPVNTGAFRQILASRATWRLLIARAMTDPVWYFYLFWFPKYLVSARHLSLTLLAQMGWWVYLGAGIGTLAAGAISGALIRSGMRARKAYRWTMLGAALLIPLSPLVAGVSSAVLCVLIASIVAFAHMAWLVTLTSLIVDLFPGSYVGRAAGLIAAGSGFGGMVSTELIAWLVTHGGYHRAFEIMAFLHPLALLILWKTFTGRQNAEDTTVFTEDPNGRVSAPRPNFLGVRDSN
jgi:ACS family hexuronate transporter-like MFS transporter